MCFSFLLATKTKPQFSPEKFDITPIILNSAIVSCGYESKSISSLVSLSNMLNTLRNKNEVSMLFAHILHETGGLVYMEEQNPGTNYYNPITHKSYHGRGYIMLSYFENYKNAGVGLSIGNRLVDDPDLVKEEKYAVKTAAWYWNNVVLRNFKVNDKNFSQSILEINGPIESTDDGKRMAEHRYELYKKIASCLRVKVIAKE